MFGRHSTPLLYNSSTYSPPSIRKVNLQAAHGPYDGDDGLDSVAVDHGSVLFALFL